MSLSRRHSQRSVPDDAKRQRIHSLDSDAAVVNQAVPFPKEQRPSFPASISVQSPALHARGSPALTGCVPPLQDTLFPDPIEASLLAATDEVMAFCACALLLFQKSKGAMGRPQTFLPGFLTVS